jgi:hypothetical protein
MGKIKAGLALMVLGLMSGVVNAAQPAPVQLVRGHATIVERQVVDADGARDVVTTVQFDGMNPIVAEYLSSAAVGIQDALQLNNCSLVGGPKLPPGTTKSVVIGYYKSERNPKTFVITGVEYDSCD